MNQIAILYGGKSGEHDISRISAAAVYRNMPQHYSVILIGIHTDGAWYLQEAPPETPSELPRALTIETDEKRRVSMVPSGGLKDAQGNTLNIHAALPILHGSFGEDGRIQGLLEIAGIPYAGSGVLGSSLSMDKDMTKRVWRDAGLPVVPWHTLRFSSEAAQNRRPGELSAEQIFNRQPSAEQLFGKLGSPLFVKPANAGSSVGVSCVKNEAELKTALQKAAQFDRKVLVEQAVSGREIECAVIGRNKIRSFAPGEIIPAGSHSFYDYDAKYTDPDGALLKVPARLTEEESSTIRTLAEKAYKSVEASGFSRVDFLREEKSGQIYLNEINTIPGMTSISLFPRMAGNGGVDFPQLIDIFIQDALAEAEWRASLNYYR